MLAFQRGQEDAFARLVERNASKVYAMIFRLIPDHAQVEDLAQEVFLRVFRTAKRYRPMAKFSTWLYRIACNVALNAIRSQRRARPTGLELSDGEDGSWQRDIPDVHLPAPPSRLDLEELQDELAQAIAALPENQRIAVTLNKFEHLSYQEISEVLGCSTMAVKSLLSRARCNLRDALSRYLGGDFLRDLPNP
jgi:RNA polymerase sigma-70 factor (ECF subfamily)